MKIVCPTCRTAYNLPSHRVPDRRAIAKCKRCENEIIIDPAVRPTIEEMVAGQETAAPSGRLPGSQTASADTGQCDSTDPQMDLAAFIGPKADKYIDIFKRFEHDDRARFAPTWHWPAALVGFWWLLYRKLYWWAVAAMVLALIPLANLVALVGFGLGGNYLYYRHAQRKVGALRTALPDANLVITLKQIGGVNRWAMVVGIVLGGLGAAGMLVSVFSDGFL